MDIQSCFFGTRTWSLFKELVDRYTIYASSHPKGFFFPPRFLGRPLSFLFFLVVVDDDYDDDDDDGDDDDDDDDDDDVDVDVHVPAVLCCLFAKLYQPFFFPRRAVFTSGKSSTAAGLTASVVQDRDLDQERLIEPGALMLAVTASAGRWHRGNIQRKILFFCLGWGIWGYGDMDSMLIC